MKYMISVEILNNNIYGNCLRGDKHKHVGLLYIIQTS
jgi:hypothetical protein